SSLMRAKWHRRLRGAIASGQAIDLAGIDGAGSLVHTSPRNDTVSRDFGQRHQDESALEHARVRQRQIRLIQYEVVVDKNSDIGGAGAVALFMNAVAPESELHFLCARQQLTWAECRRNHDREVDEMRLILEAPWWRSVVGRASYQTHVLFVAEQSDCAIENSATVSNIATQRHQRFRHGGSSQALPRRR